ncbi:unnamed protein product [Urochloa decumbens]|uniref:chitinase n=1 Tax=Urochloa decumbens TaxID=240449 RepID=A0ABC9ASJ3_9POAL
MMRAAQALVLVVLAGALAVSARAAQCGDQANGALCPGCLCCSFWGFCGSTPDFCAESHCQSQCDGCSGSSSEGGSISSILTQDLFDTLLKNRNGAGCKAQGFYTYDALITAADAFPGFGTTGSLDTQKRELAAFLGQTELVASDPIVSFKAAIWFWMTPQGNKPSCHDVITNQWTPSPADVAAGRLPGYGVITNIINGGIKCGKGYKDEVANRTFFYTSYCDILGISPGDNLDCYNQRNFDNVSLPAGASTENRADA